MSGQLNLSYWLPFAWLYPSALIGGEVQGRGKTTILSAAPFVLTNQHLPLLGGATRPTQKGKVQFHPSPNTSMSFVGNSGFHKSHDLGRIPNYIKKSWKPLCTGLVFSISLHEYRHYHQFYFAAFVASILHPEAAMLLC